MKKHHTQVNKAAPAPPKRALLWLSIAAIAALTFAVLSPSLQAGFTNWDDNYYVTDNPLVINTTVPLAKIATTPVALNYHPLTVLTLALNYQFGKLDPAGYHAVNLILHLLNTILVFFFIFLLTRRNLLMAAIVALFFGIHPVHVESVTWISERKDVLYVCFFLAGLITYLKYSDTKKIIWYVATLLLFVLSCLSKAMAVVFPVALLLVDYLQGIKWNRTQLINKIPFFLIALIFGVIAVKIQLINIAAVKMQPAKAIADIRHFNLLQRALFFCYGALMYMVKMVYPFNLSSFYPYPDSNNIPVIYYLSPVIFIAVAGWLVYLFRKKQKAVVFGLLFYFLCILLVLQFFSFGAAIIADRYSYLSYIGLFFVVAYLVNAVWQSKQQRISRFKYPVMLLVVVAALTFNYQAYARTLVWMNSGTLWTDVINNYPNVSLAYVSRADYYKSINDIEHTLADYNTAIQLDPTNRDAYFGRGILYSLYYKKDDLAVADYTAALKIDTGFAQAYANRGMIYLEHGKNDLALTDFNKALTLDSTIADAYNDRGALYLSAGKPGNAIADDAKAIAHNPSNAVYYYNLALGYKTTGNFEKAKQEFTQGVQLAPANAELYYNMIGICNDSLKQYKEAVANFSKAMELNPNIKDFITNRAFAEAKVENIK